jgi:cold shock CspA family protein
LYRNRAKVTDKVFVPLKLIVTDNVDTTNQVIKGTNRQTAVQVEAFESLQPFHKQLEEFYNSFKVEKPLYYERRSRQYDGYPIPTNQIISLAAQTQSFLAMFLNEPHSTHRYYGELLKANEDKIFIEGHSPYPYYTSGYAAYLLQSFFQSKQISPKYRVFRYHMLMLFRLLAEKSPLPYLNNKKMEQYCSSLREILWDEARALPVFQRAAELTDQALRKSPYGAYESARRKAFTEDLMLLSSSQKQPLAATVERERGTVKSFSEMRGWGFIVSESYARDVFVHYADIRGTGYRNLIPGQTVEFMLVKTDKGFIAKDVCVVSQ